MGTSAEWYYQQRAAVRRAGHDGGKGHSEKVIDRHLLLDAAQGYRKYDFDCAPPSSRRSAGARSGKGGGFAADLTADHFAALARWPCVKTCILRCEVMWPLTGIMKCCAEGFKIRS